MTQRVSTIVVLVFTYVCCPELASAFQTSGFQETLVASGISSPTAAQQISE